MAGVIRVWIDTDISVRPGGHECDDGFALVQALNSPELSIAGVSTVFGNTDVATATAIARDFAARFAPGLAVVEGAGAAGADTAAAAALIAALDDAPLTVVALGPLTNVAAALARRPDLAARLTLVAVAGRQPGQRFLVGSATRPFRDLNFECDVPAFAAVLGAVVPLTLAGWEASRDVRLTAADLDALADGPPAARWLAGPARDWLSLWTREFGVPWFTPFDTLAVGALTDPDTLSFEDARARIEVLADDRTAGRDKPYLLVEPGVGRPVRVVRGGGARFVDRLRARLLRPGDGAPVRKSFTPR